MRKIMCLFISFVLVISICFGSVFAEEIVFDVSEEAKETEETVFEEPANWDEEESVTEDSFVIEEEFVSEDSSLAEDEMILLEDVQSKEVVSSEDAAYVDEDLVSDDYAISEDEVISGETITDDPSFENVVASGTCGDKLTWKLTGEEGNMTLTISGSGAMYDYGNYDDGNYSPWPYRSLINKVIITQGITSIGGYAFYDCRSLSDISIPDSVTSIGTYAFYGCSSMTSITIPNSVESIDSNAFRRCNSLKSILIPERVTSIGEVVFAECKSLININVSSNNPVYTSNNGVLINATQTLLVSCPEGKSGKYAIPDSVTSIGDWAFLGCSSLVGITIPDSVTSIGDSAFSGCSNLTGITIPDSVTSIGDNAFLECKSLANITIPNSVTSIGDWAFLGCSSLIGITIPDSVTSIGDCAFSGCSNLTGITIPDSVMSIGDGAFSRCSNLTGITIPDSVTSIGEDAFYNCPNLIIHGYSGSYAEKYAKENNIPFKSLSAALVSNIALDKAEHNLFIGDTATIKATVSPSDAKDKTLNYKSDITSIAKVNKSGKITAVAVGTATITVSANDGSGVKASCIVNVYNKPTAGLNITKKTLYTKGEPHQFILTPTVNNGELVSVTYSSFAPKIAYVAKSGKVTGKGAGTATITATVKMKNECGSVTKKLTCKVTVKKPTLTVSPTNVGLKKGVKQKLTVKATPKGNVSYTSSDTKIATVSKAGKITAKKKGSCNITVECNGVKKTVKVTVK